MDEAIKKHDEQNSKVFCTSSNKEEILGQPLFLNNQLKKVDDIYIYKWFYAGIKQIKDIMYEVIPVCFFPVQVIRDAIVENYDDETKAVLENKYKKCKEVIHNEWINILEGNKKKTTCNDGMVVDFKLMTNSMLLKMVL